MYYFLLHSDGTQEGPLDLIMLIKRVRSGRLRHDALVFEESRGQAEALPAIMHPDLAEIFREVEHVPETTEPLVRHTFEFGRLLRGGWQFLQDHHGITVYSGLYTVLAILPMMVIWGFLPWFVSIPLGLIVHIGGTYALIGLMWMILRFHRGQPADPETVVEMLKQRRSDLLPAALIIGILSYVGLLLFAVPGIFVLTFALPALMLVVEHHTDAWEALAISRQKLISHGSEAVGTMFGLAMIGFIGALAVFPPVLLLPITLYGFAMVYDEIF